MINGFDLNAPPNFVDDGFLDDGFRDLLVYSPSDGASFRQPQAARLWMLHWNLSTTWTSCEEINGKSKLENSLSSFSGYTLLPLHSLVHARAHWHSGLSKLWWQSKQ
jgi:hypothetical protein